MTTFHQTAISNDIIEQIPQEIPGTVYASLIDTKTGSMQPGAFSSFGQDPKPFVAYSIEINNVITKQVELIHQNTEQPIEIISRTGTYLHVFRYVMQQKYLLYLIADTDNTSLAWLRHVLQKYN